MTTRVLWPDTNITRNATSFLSLVRLANQRRVPVIIHPQVDLETRRFKRLEKGVHFDEQLFDSVFAPGGGLQIETLMLDLEWARQWADLLAGRFPTKDLWQRAKGGQRASMTTDWRISLTIEKATDAVAITEDTGAEWEYLREQGRVLSFKDARTWLESIPPVVA